MAGSLDHDGKQPTAADSSAEKARTNSGQLFGNLNTLKREGDRGTDRRASLKDQSQPQGFFGNAFSKLVKPESK